MNSSFRSQESQMQAAALLAERQREQRRVSLTREKEDELALFLEMWKCEKEQSNILDNSEESDAPLGSKPGSLPVFKISSSTPATREPGSDDFLNSDNDKNDYNWLMTPPGTPLFPSLEMEPQKTVMSQIGTPTARPASLKSRLANPQTEHNSKGCTLSKQAASSPGRNSSIAGSQRPSSSGGPVSRSSMPFGLPKTSTTSKSSRSLTPTSRATFPSSRPSVSGAKSSAAASKPSASAAKPTTSVVKATTSVAKLTVPARSSTPLSRSTDRSSTPSSRPSIPPSKSISRAATPTRRPSTQSRAPPTSAPCIKSSSWVIQAGPVTSRNPVPSPGSSPTVKPRLCKTSDMPGFPLDAPTNLRTSLSERPLSATRGRPGAPSSRSSSIEPGTNVRSRLQSCSPSRGRVCNGNVRASGSSVPALRHRSKVDDNVSPVVIGVKMVERVTNMRKLMPPRQDNKLSLYSNLSKKSSSSPDSLGFGRMLSKKSLDMAIRHMDIRRAIPGYL